MSCPILPEDSRAFDAGAAHERHRIINLLYERRNILKTHRFNSHRIRIEEVDLMLIILEALG